MTGLASSPRTLPRNCLRKWSPPTSAGTRTLVSRLSPRHKPPVTELGPASPHFFPRKWGQTTRLSMYYDNIIAPNYLLMSYDPTAKVPKQILPLRWDGTSPYHKNRPQPREPRPLPLRHPIRVKTIPRVKAITLHSMMKSALVRKSDVLNAAQALQSITGQRPSFIRSKSNIQAFRLRPGAPIAVKVTIKGPQMLAFLSVLAETVLPRVPDFVGVHFVRNEKNGSINFGFGPNILALFPQIETNFDSYSPLPGFDISIATTATTTADARLLLSAYGIPFKKGLRHVPKNRVGFKSLAKSLKGAAKQTMPKKR